MAVSWESTRFLTTVVSCAALVALNASSAHTTAQTLMLTGKVCDEEGRRGKLELKREKNRVGEE